MYCLFLCIFVTLFCINVLFYLLRSQVNVDRPPSAATYTHRAGRTGRAGAAGMAVGDRLLLIYFEPGV